MELEGWTPGSGPNLLRTFSESLWSRCPKIRNWKWGYHPGTVLDDHRETLDPVSTPVLVPPNSRSLHSTRVRAQTHTQPLIKFPSPQSHPPYSVLVGPDSSDLDLPFPTLVPLTEKDSLSRLPLHRCYSLRDSNFLPSSSFNGAG